MLRRMDETSEPHCLSSGHGTWAQHFPRRQAESQSKHLTCPVVRPKAVISVSDISLLISMVALESWVTSFTASTAATLSGQAAYQTLAVAPAGSGVVTVTTQPNTFSGMNCQDERTPLLGGERREARTEDVSGIYFSSSNTVFAHLPEVVLGVLV